MVFFIYLILWPLHQPISAYREKKSRLVDLEDHTEYLPSEGMMNFAHSDRGCADRDEQKFAMEIPIFFC